jgi:hypothetical protein
MKPQAVPNQVDARERFAAMLNWSRILKPPNGPSSPRPLPSPVPATSCFRQSIRDLKLESFGKLLGRFKAFEWLDRAYAKHNDGLIQTKVDPLLKSLRNDPRFATFLKKLNLAN